MNEEANFCDQCGSKINSDTKFCPNCGHDLKNSSTKITSDKTIKVEVTNVTVEKGFKAIEKGVKEAGTGLKDVFKTKEKTSKSNLETPPQKPWGNGAPETLVVMIFVAVFVVALFYVMINK